MVRFRAGLGKCRILVFEVLNLWQMGDTPTSRPALELGAYCIWESNTLIVWLRSRLSSNPGEKVEALLGFMVVESEPRYQNKQQSRPLNSLGVLPLLLFETAVPPQIRTFLSGWLGILRRQRAHVNLPKYPQNNGPHVPHQACLEAS